MSSFLGSFSSNSYPPSSPPSSPGYPALSSSPLRLGPPQNRRALITRPMSSPEKARELRRAAHFAQLQKTRAAKAMRARGGEDKMIENLMELENRHWLKEREKGAEEIVVNEEDELEFEAQQAELLEAERYLEEMEEFIEQAEIQRQMLEQQEYENQLQQQSVSNNQQNWLQSSQNHQNTYDDSEMKE